LVWSASLSLPEFHQEILKLFAPVAQMAQPNLGSPHRVFRNGMNEDSFFKVRGRPVEMSDSFAPVPPEVFYRDRHCSPPYCFALSIQEAKRGGDSRVKAAEFETETLPNVAVPENQKEAVFPYIAPIRQCFPCTILADFGARGRQPVPRSQRSRTGPGRGALCAGGQRAREMLDKLEAKFLAGEEAEAPQ
jgi:hypothetical protein